MLDVNNYKNILGTIIGTVVGGLVLWGIQVILPVTRPVLGYQMPLWVPLLIGVASSVIIIKMRNCYKKALDEKDKEIERLTKKLKNNEMIREAGILTQESLSKWEPFINY